MLAYVEARETSTSIVVDGYTSNKTEKGIIRDVARALEKYSKSESEFLMRTAKDFDELFNNPFVPQYPDSEEMYFFIYEEVPCACKWIEEKEEMEYKEGFCNYFCIRIMK